MKIMTDQHEALDEVLNTLKETRLAIGDDGESVDIDAYAVTAPAAELLERVSRIVQADTILEIGIASGLSTLSISRGRLAGGPMREKSYHAIDPNQSRYRNIGILAFQRAGIEPLIEYHDDESLLALPRLLERNTRLQFAFVDGKHQLDHVMMELLFIDRMLDVGGVLAIHDMWMPGLQHALSYWLTNRAYEAVTLKGERIVAEPCVSENRQCGEPDRWLRHFNESIEPYVDWSTLFIRKVGEDERVWDFFSPYA